jgi:vacuolar-type H+-ATPase subunit H
MSEQTPDQPAPRAGSEGSVAVEVTGQVHSIVRAAEEVAGAVKREAEQRAQARLKEAEADASQRLAAARREADALLDERRRRLSELSDALMEQVEALLGELDRGRAVRTQLERVLEDLTVAGSAIEGERSGAGPPAVEGESPVRAADRDGDPDPGTAARSALEADRTTNAGSDRAQGDRVARARLVAVQMVRAGSSRAEVAAHLQRTFGLWDCHEVLDAAFKSAGTRA